jgi:hypothetical protein
MIRCNKCRPDVPFGNQLRKTNGQCPDCKTWYN